MKLTFLLLILAGPPAGGEALARPMSYADATDLARSLGVSIPMLAPLSQEICIPATPQNLRQTLEKQAPRFWPSLDDSWRDDVVRTVSLLLEREGCTNSLPFEDETARAFPGAFFLRQGLRLAAVNAALMEFSFDKATESEWHAKAAALERVLNPELAEQVSRCADDNLEKRRLNAAYLILHAAARSGTPFASLEDLEGVYTNALETVCGIKDR